MNSIFLQLIALALNVWREAARDRAFHILFGFGIFVLLFSLPLGQMSVGGEERILQSMGFWILGIWGLLIVLHTGSGIVRRELQQKTVYLALSRPVPRPVFLTGKFLGVVSVLTSLFFLLTTVTLLIWYSRGIPVSAAHYYALIFIYGEWILLASVSLFFASFTSPLLHNFFLISFSFLGHWSGDLRIFAENAKNPSLQLLLKGLHWIVPNLEILSFRKDAIFGAPINPDHLANGVLVLVCWITFFLAAANLIFSRRKLL